MASDTDVRNYVIGGKRKLQSLLPFCVPDELLDRPQLYDMVESQTEVIRLSQNIRRAGDSAVRGRAAVIVNKGSINWSTSILNAAVYGLGLKTWEVLLVVEAFKLLEELCTESLKSLGGMQKYEWMVRKLRDFMETESTFFGNTLPKFALWTSNVDFGVFSSCIARVKEQMPMGSMKTKELLEKASCLFHDVLEEVLSKLEEEDPGVEISLITESIKVVKDGDKWEPLIGQFARVARLKTERNQNAHPFNGGAVMAEAVELYSNIVHQVGYEFRELGGLCLLSLHIKQRDIENKVKKEVSQQNDSCQDSIQKLEAEPLSPTSSDDLENLLELDL